jgi:[CysO sulfur-carrier protein]-S-L-cysteine hydrolase
MSASEPAWVKGGLTIDGGVVRTLEAEAEAAYARHEEACGFLSGPAAAPLVCDQATVMPNLANKYHQLDPEAYPRKGNTYFLLDARKFQRALEEGTASGRPVKVLWHSHLDVGAYFSETDAAAANMGGDAPANPLAYLVTSVRNGKVDEHKLFIWNADGKAFIAAPFEVVPERPGA